MSGIRVLLVGKQSDFFRGAADWLASGDRIDLVGMADSGADAIAVAERLAPDVVLLDESVPDMKVSEVVRRLKSIPAAPRVLLLSFFDGGATRRIAAATGADCVVAKARFTAELLPALDELLVSRPRPTAAASARSKPTSCSSPGNEITRSES